MAGAVTEDSSDLNIASASIKLKGARLTALNLSWAVNRGTATAPIHKAYERDIEIKVWVDNTPLHNQGASLTRWELKHNRVQHRSIMVNAGGHLKQHGMVDLVIVGSERTTSAADVCNKISTYLEALAARQSGIPFYSAIPTSNIDPCMWVHVWMIVFGYTNGRKNVSANIYRYVHNSRLLLV